MSTAGGRGDDGGQRGEGEASDEGAGDEARRAPLRALYAAQYPHLTDALAQVPSRLCNHPLAEVCPDCVGAHYAAMRETTSRVAHAEAGVEYPEPAPGRGRHPIVARREWHVRVERTPLVLRVGAVLVLGGAGDVAAYMAVADDDDWIADHGTKLGFSDAALLFPGITEGRYRK